MPGRSDLLITATLEVELTVPPMPSICFTSGVPMTFRKMSFHSLSSAGRSSLWKNTALLVPPRIYTQGNFRCFWFMLIASFKLAIRFSLDGFSIPLSKHYEK